ncbi:MAG: LysE family transporter [Deltaproteobacteria bacterium]|nr:LysE family transporter [Deltaproteobacteria bacterium]
MLIAALVGLVAAFLASMPVAGPIAALVVRHALEGRPKTAMMLGFGTGLAEGVYAFLALWGFSAILVQYPVVIPISKIVAAIILIGLGFWFTRFTPHTPGFETTPSAPAPAAPEAKHKRPTLTSLQVDAVMKRAETAERPKQAFGIGFTVTLLNPTLLATWAAASTTIMSMKLFQAEASNSVAFALGVVVGGTGWFVLLSWLLSRFRHRFSPLTLQRIIRAMGWGLMALGVWFVIAFVLWLTKSP